MARNVQGALFAILFLFFLFPAPAGAEQDGETAYPSFQDQGELAFIQTGGNTDITSLSLKNTFTARLNESNRLIQKAAVLYGKDQGKKNAESYDASLRWEHDFSIRLYSYTAGGWFRDVFKGIDDRFQAGAGAGYTLIKTERHSLLFEAGGAWVTEQYTNGMDNDYAEGRTFGRYDLKISEKTKAFQDLEYLVDLGETENYRINSETGIITSLGGAFSLKASYTVNFDNQPTPDTLDGTDTVLAVTLVMNL
ncbi:MAG: DUF481 domain-containing protein [Proteobacteria bacterium]|nr:DUF481 domain-containing protein [Pseudomonadota bacterium]